MGNQPSIYDLLNSAAMMDGVNTSAGDATGPAGSLHWTPGSQQAQMDPRGIPTMPNMPPQRQQDIAPPPPDADMQAYSDRLLHSPDLAPPQDYVGGTPDGGMTQPRQSIGRQIVAPLRDALSSLFNPGAASHPNQMPAPSMGADPGTLQGQSQSGDPMDYMRDRYRKYADLTDQNMQTMQNQQRGYRRQDGIDGFLGKVVAPITGGMMARGGNRYAMDAMNQYSKGAEARGDMHRDEQYRLMDASNRYGKQAYDQMQAADPETIKNQLLLYKAMNDGRRVGAYENQVQGQNTNGAMNATTNQANATTKQMLAQNELQKTQDLRDQFGQKMQDEVNKTNELLRNGAINRQLAEARINDLHSKAGQFSQMMDYRNKQLQAQLYTTDANNAGALDRFMRGENYKQDAATATQNANFKSQANKRIPDKSGRMVPMMSPGFVSEYGTPDPVDPQSDGSNDLMSGFRNFFFGQPATAAPQAISNTPSQQYIPSRSDLPAMQAALRAKMQGAQ